eukprot:GAHX01003452.1.p3 GENE.GAHX01003452.1~~GAHX01003452.1.p3  ORF type:complete len:54 (-),score=4.54 GAHX01003452.1:478-639(-)
MIGGLMHCYLLSAVHKVQWIALEIQLFIQIALSADRKCCAESGSSQVKKSFVT